MWPGAVRDVTMAPAPHLRCAPVRQGSVGHAVTSWDVPVVRGVQTVVTSVPVTMAGGVILSLERVPVLLGTWETCVR